LEARRMIHEPRQPCTRAGHTGGSGGHRPAHRRPCASTTRGIRAMTSSPRRRSPKCGRRSWPSGSPLAAPRALV